MARFGVTLCVIAALFVAADARYTFPMYKQCDPRWGSNEMGVKGPGERNTICREGCAMTSLSMWLFGMGIEVGGVPANPATLNAWLEANDGYDCADGDCNNLVLDIPSKISSRISLIGELPPPPVGNIAQGLALQNMAYIAHVRDQSHFVLLISAIPGTTKFEVHDPFYNQTVYDVSEIHDIIMYHISSPVPEPQPMSAVIPFSYPLYKQCDPRWGNDIIETTTICAVGCLMSSTSMAIGGKSIPVNGATSNPGVLNTWLRNNGGYTSGNDMIESQIPKINPSHISWPGDAMHRTNDLPYYAIAEYLRAGRPVIANVMHGHHFVLVVGYDSAGNDTLWVNDPGFAKTTYSYKNDVVGWRLFNMTHV